MTKKTPFQVMEDKVRIANKVNKKYQELLNDLEKDYKDACNELGPEEVAALLEKQLEAKLEVKTNVPDTRKDGKYLNYNGFLLDLEFFKLTMKYMNYNFIINFIARVSFAIDVNDISSSCSAPSSSQNDSSGGKKTEISEITHGNIQRYIFFAFIDIFSITITLFFI